MTHKQVEQDTSKAHTLGIPYRRVRLISCVVMQPGSDRFSTDVVEVGSCELPQVCSAESVCY